MLQTIITCALAQWRAALPVSSHLAHPARKIIRDAGRGMLARYMACACAARATPSRRAAPGSWPVPPVTPVPPLPPRPPKKK